MAASRGVEQDEMRLRDVFSRGSDARRHKTSGGTEDVNPVGPRGGRSSWLAAALAIGLIWSTPGLAQTWPAHPKPAPRAHEPGRPYRPSYGRWSPGQVLPQTAGAVVITDYQSFHLRRPPRGYTWMQCDGDFILTNADGLIFEVIPGGGR
jgi:Ni/Co efflux regulator RcnB